VEEALGYYSLAFSRDKESPCAAEALAGRMKILAMKKQLDDALDAAQHILLHYPHSPEALDARMETARILHDMSLFKESLAALSGLESGPSHTVYQRPEISLYLGYNALKLRNYSMARENLLRFYNMSPRSTEAPLVLSRIGDAYREEDVVEAAEKIYRYTVQHHPDSEGALISQVRLAEMQEQEVRKAAEKSAGSREGAGEKAPSIRETYEKIVKSSAQKDAKSPHAALALTRLAELYQKEGENAKSLAMAKELLERFPGQQMQKETEQILLKALQEMLRESLGNEDYSKAVSLYYEEKDLFHKIRSPELFLATARAFLRLDLKEDAAELFKAAGALLPDGEKPSDLIYFLAWDLHRRNKPEQALERLRAITEKDKDKEVVSRAYQLRARILVRQKQWDKALEAFASALKQPPDPCIHLEILTERASAMASCGMKEAALKSVEQARDLAKGCANPALGELEDLAGVFFLLGRTDEALALLRGEAGKEENRKEGARLQWKMAQYHESLGQRESSQTVYQQLAQAEDPLWARLANDRMEEIRFQRDMESFRRP
jgi:tetratricopeptide (TPR) repeat protein